MLIRKAEPGDAEAIAAIILPTIRAGETYAIDPEMEADEAVAYWLGADKETFIAVEGGQVVGTYYLRANQAGGGDHVANCGYMTHPAHGGRGIAGRLCEHSLERARARGFRAIQFNFVVSTNVRAVRLWERFGFDVVGRLPGAFRHPTAGFVDALVMYRAL